MVGYLGTSIHYPPLTRQQIATNELNWFSNPVLLMIWKMALDIHRRNSIAQQGKDPAPEEYISRSRPEGK
jgi:hypothetical protein